MAYRSFKNINSLKSPQYFKTWAIKITVNCALDCVRKNKKTVYLEPEHEKYIGSNVEYGEKVILSLSLQNLLNKLNEMERGIVLLKHYYNYTFKEIAEIVDMPAGTIKSVLYRSLEKLRKYSKEAGFYEK